MKRSRALDGLRGIAILMVLVWHYLPKLPPTPEALLYATGLFWSGVDLFFVLSGFLIAGILLKNARAKNYFSTFYIRRAARIVPLYLLILFVLVLFVHYQPDFLKKAYRGHLPLWSYFTFTQNFVYAARSYFDDPWMDVTWSLAVEEQFYVLLSLLVWRVQRRSLAISSAALILLAPILRYLAPNLIVAMALPFQRADSLMLGVLIALLWQWDQGKDFIHRHACYVRGAFVGLAAGALLLNHNYTLPGDALGHSWLAFFYGDLLLLALMQDSASRWSGILSNPILNWLGLRSYGIYLLHKPLQILIPFLLGGLLHLHISVGIQVCIFSAAVFLAAEISYRLVEKPITDWGHRFKYEPQAATG